ncbi:MAG: N-acetyltransferase family protein [Candidatus Tectimicrobiota bacterium]
MRIACPEGWTTLQVTEQPTSEQLEAWWEAMHNDDISVAYADSFPATLFDFCLDVARERKRLLICLVDGEVAGAAWLHDLLCGDDGRVHTGWVGLYFLPAYRGQVAIHLWQTARQHWEAAGMQHLFAAVNIANRRSQVFVTRGMRFHRLGIFAQFTMFHGQPTDVVLYAMHADDTSLAWSLAAARAACQMQGVSA